MELQNLPLHHSQENCDHHNWLIDIIWAHIGFITVDPRKIHIHSPDQNSDPQEWWGKLCRFQYLLCNPDHEYLCFVGV